MKITIIGGVVGGIILYVWSFVAWVLLPMHEDTFHGIKNEDGLVAAIQPHLDEKAIYIFPKSPGMKADQTATEAWAAKFVRGPRALIIYDPSGGDPTMPRQMAIGLLLDILASVVVCWYLLRSTALYASYFSRVMYCGMFGIFVSLFGYLMSWNWMNYPGDFTSAMVMDGIVSWILAGLGIAAIVKAPHAPVA